MKIVSVTSKGLCALALAAFLVACGGDKQGQVPSNSNEPAWVTSMSAAKEKAGSVVVGIGSAKILDGNLNYAVNQAAMQARAEIAQQVSAKIQQAIESLEQNDGMKISANSQQVARQKVEADLKKTEIAEKWTDKQATPPMLYVLVKMDEKMFEQTLKGVGQVLNVDADQARKLSETVQELLE